MKQQFYDKFHKRQVIRVPRLTRYGKIVNGEFTFCILWFDTYESSFIVLRVLSFEESQPPIKRF